MMSARLRALSTLGLALGLGHLTVFSTCALAGDRSGLELPRGNWLPSSVMAYQAEEDVSEPASSTDRWFDGERPWKGFITGLRDGFETFPRPIGSPIYFEDPFINTDTRPVVLYNEFPRSSFLGGGDVVVLAAQARVAITERFQFFANIDGWGDLEADNLPDGEGTMALGMGLKYAFYANPDTLGIVSAGIGWRPSNGSSEIFQNLEDEITLFVTGARQFWDKWRFISSLVGRITTHHEKGNDILSWNLNVSYELFENFFPLIEYHGLLYLSNGSRVPVRDGLLDYSNLGASDVRDSSAHWLEFGYRWNFIEHVSWGTAFGYGVRDNSNNDIFDRRVTMNLIFTY